MKIIRAIKHALKGERLSLDESVNLSQFEELIHLGGENLHYRVRAGRGYDWVTEKDFSPPIEGVRNWFKEENNELCEAKFFGRHQAYSNKERDTHYIDCYEWIIRGNSSMVPQKGCKSHEGVAYFEVLKRAKV